MFARLAMIAMYFSNVIKNTVKLIVELCLNCTLTDIFDTCFASTKDENRRRKQNVLFFRTEDKNRR